MIENGLFTEIINEAMVYIPKLPSVILTLVIGIMLIKILKRITERIMKRFRLDATVISFVIGFMTFACWVFLISIVFSILGFPQISIAFSGSIALVIVGVATNANSMIQDLLAGIFLIADPDFKVGASVKVTNVSGEVVRLDIKKTKIKDGAGNIHVISNKVFDNNVYTIESNDRT